MDDESNFRSGSGPNRFSGQKIRSNFRSADAWADAFMHFWIGLLLTVLIGALLLLVVTFIANAGWAAVGVLAFLIVGPVVTLIIRSFI